jgi:hypothetical protein
MANYTDKEKQEVKNVFQSLAVGGDISIREIVGGLAIPDYNARAMRRLLICIKQLPSSHVPCYLDSARIMLGEGADILSVCMKADELIFADLCELLTEQDIDSCLRHHIDYSNILEGYERDQAGERSGWQSMIHLDNAERVTDINADDMRRTWSLFV